ncbi:SitI3 family protein [Actinoplanes teichomyceticus]|uniref:Uncharacterized protein n=1 Tax=Actinoplanes teichomyceticus TaxID=1867 RepID=A0A561WB58_ACTTI|nr:SitI3 family protein [Actinoplanes teichomyceticus]TWG21091.1 hypothetical protein FHX34_103621 [Actinoplanes teichomyceticus]GIF14910.1 hypothetical protein Ate01nite_49420 [Actinoplanes teichomyceticus]
MAIDYRLTIGGATLIDDVAARAFPEPAERPAGTASLASADLSERYGFAVSLYTDRNGYLEAEADDGMWEWEPAEFVSMMFRVEKTVAGNRAVIPMLIAVRRLLDSGPEDVALDLNGSWLLLTRIAGTLTRYKQAAWWARYPSADRIIHAG